LRNLAKAVLILIVMPILLVGVTCLEASPNENTNFKPRAFLKDSVFNPGEFHYINVTLDFESENIYVVAYSGNSLPESDMRSAKNYYKWEYNYGVWGDASGHDFIYIDVSKCSKTNNSYSFCISLSKKVNPGSWVIKIFVDNKEVSSKSLNFIVGDFCLFFSAIIGVFQPCIKERNPLVEKEIICFDQKRKILKSEKDIGEAVDDVLRKQSTSQNNEISVNKKFYLSTLNEKPLDEEEIVKSNVFTYPRSKLKIFQNNGAGSLFFGKILDNLNGFCKFFFVIILAIFLILSCISPMVISPGNNLGDSDITIINVRSYPVVGGTWSVRFTTVGKANLTISAANGTTWSDSNDSCDLRFIDLICDNESLEYRWVNNSVFIENYSSNEIGYKTSRVFTPGIHILRFQFGDDVAYAYNSASEYWNQTNTADFNSGTKYLVNVSNNAFKLNTSYYIRNTTLVNNESFEGAWPPTGWSATGLWNKEGDQVKFGAWSADHDGAGGGGSTGNLVTSNLNCSSVSGKTVRAIYIYFYGYSDGADNGEYYLDYYNGVAWNQITRLDNFGAGAWANYSQKITDSQYFKTNFQIRWRVVGLDNNEHVYVDGVIVACERNETGYETAGSLTSVAKDTGRNVPAFTGIAVGNSTPPSTTITKWIRAADTQAGLSSATWYSGVASVPHKRWVQWRINLTGNQYNTSTVNDVNITWTYDNDKPTSSVNAITPYWQNTNPFTVSATASDVGGSGLKEVALYYSYSADNSTGWSGWTKFGTNDTSSPYSWSFNLPSGNGYYRFYSRAVDNESNIEDAPGAPGYDRYCGADTVKPSSEVDDLPKYWYNRSLGETSVTINVSSASDSLSGVKDVTLYYRYRIDNDSSWDSWASFGVDTAAPWSWNFNFPYGNGHYQFYSIAEDNASNLENSPTSPDNDTECGYISLDPTSTVDPISPYWQKNSPLLITGQGLDRSGTGLKNITLYFFNSTDNITWSGPWVFGVDSDPWVAISWNFNFPNGTGYYRFYSIAVDNDTPPGVEDFTINDTGCGYDINKPSSQLDSISSYWQNQSDNPLTITASSVTDDLSGVQNVTLYYYNSSDNNTWHGPWNFDVDNSTPWSWSFTFPNGTGYYRFYSGAFDMAGNLEDFTANDTQCGYDTTSPTSSIDTITTYWKYVSPITITSSNPADTISGVKDVTFYYRYRIDNESAWDSWASFDTDNSSPWFWSFTFPSGEGHYEFYSISADNANNIEIAPASNDTRCGYKILNSFTERLWSQSNAVSSAGLTLTSSTNADGSATGTWADANGGWTNPVEYWDFTIADNSGTIGPIVTVTLYIKHYQSGWSDDDFKIQIFNGTSWIDVRTYTAGSGPPIGNTTNNWDLKILGIDTWSEINAAIVRITGISKSGGEDIVRWYVDTVELRVTAQYVAPVINSYDLRNSTGSKLNGITGLIDVNKEYYFSVNITDLNGWGDISDIEIKAWYDHGDDDTAYNQTEGGNLNMYLKYKNTTGTANFSILWPDNEVQLVSANCSETIVNITTRVINISFKPFSQVRWASSNNTWDATQNNTNDQYSWNFNIMVIDAEDKTANKKDEYGIYKFSYVLPVQDWVDIIALPGYADTSNVVTITYSSNYNFNISICFEENLTNVTLGSSIPIADSVYILANADLNDDITTDRMFTGIGEVHSIDILNDSGIFNENDISQTVNVQFNVYIPFGTPGGKYTARVNTKIKHD